MKKSIAYLLVVLCLLMMVSCTAAPVENEAAESGQPEASQIPLESGQPADSAVPSESEEPSDTSEPSDQSVGFEALYQKMLDAEILPEMMEFPESMVLDFYGIDPADYTEAVFYQSFDSMLADEVVLVNAMDDAAADRVEEMLNVRLEAKAEEAKGYSPEQFAIIEKCSVIRDGMNVIMIVSPKKDVLVEIFMKGIA